MKTFSKTPGAGETSCDVACVVCGSRDSKPYWDCGAFSFVRCCRCGHVFQNPQPEPVHLIDRYDQEYADYEVENSANFLDLMLRGLADVSFFDRFQRSGIEQSLLDVGCATGALLQYARGRGLRVQGVEVCRPAAEYGIATRGVPIAIGSLPEVVLPGDDPRDGIDSRLSRFGAIHASHVIEHVANPRQFLSDIRERLLPGGFLVVVTPNTSGMQSRIFGSEWRSAIADHVHLFSARNLRRLLRETGFRCIASQTWGGLGVGTAPAWLKRPVDRLAKWLRFGDVVLLLARSLATGSPDRS
jgi:2-polyprenyl-3-methyl-5-hydroxy-6-metoxy-1,4-benzoquinol methylase